MTATATRRPEGALDVTTATAGPVAVLTLAGDLDAATADVVRDEVGAAMRAHPRVVLDLRGVRHVTGVGLRTLLLVYRQGQCLRTTMALVGLSPDLHDLLSATGYLRFFRIAGTTDEALALLAQQPSEQPAEEGHDA